MKHQPAGYDAADENKVLLAFERGGQALTTTSALIFSGTNLKPFLIRSVARRFSNRIKMVSTAHPKIR